MTRDPEDGLHHSTIFSEIVTSEGMDVFAVDEYLTSSRLFQPQDDLGCRRLAAARLSNHAKVLPVEWRS